MVKRSCCKCCHVHAYFQFQKTPSPNHEWWNSVDPGWPSKAGKWCAKKWDPQQQLRAVQRDYIAPSSSSNTYLPNCVIHSGRQVVRSQEVRRHFDDLAVLLLTSGYRTMLWHDVCRTLRHSGGVLFVNDDDDGCYSDDCGTIVWRSLNEDV